MLMARPKATCKPNVEAIKAELAELEADRGGLRRLGGPARSTMNKLLAGNAVTLDTMKCLVSAINKARDSRRWAHRELSEFVSDGGRNQAETIQACIQEPSHLRLPEDWEITAFSDGDLKDILVDKPTSRMLLDNSPPCFAQAVACSRTVMPNKDADKDFPVVEGWDYNHFIAPGAVVAITSDSDDEPKWLMYSRSPSPVGSSHVHTQGWAILWGASYAYRIPKLPGQPMDQWMRTAEAQINGRSEGIASATDGLLRSLLTRKLRIQNLQFTSAPLAVITNDQREKTSDKETRRVYTQYVFGLTITLPRSTVLHDLIQSLPIDGVELRIVPTNVDPMRQFRDKKGRTNTMDVLAWHCINGSLAHKGGVEAAQCTKGFALLPE
jgi:hypothetical protein